MKRLFILIFALGAVRAGAEGFRFSWNLGDIGGGYGILENRGVFNWNFGRFAWRHGDTGLGLAVTLVQTDSTSVGRPGENGVEYVTDVSYATLCPLEVFYAPLWGRQASVGLFARGGLETRWEEERADEAADSALFAGAGVKAGFVFLRLGSYQAYVFNASAEYTTRGVFRLSVTCDFLVPLFFILFASR